jgi:hypothetical protein
MSSVSSDPAKVSGGKVSKPKSASSSIVLKHSDESRTDEHAFSVSRKPPTPRALYKEAHRKEQQLLTPGITADHELGRKWTTELSASDRKVWIDKHKKLQEDFRSKVLNQGVY